MADRANRLDLVITRLEDFHISVKCKYYVSQVELVFDSEVCRDEVANDVNDNAYLARFVGNGIVVAKRFSNPGVSLHLLDGFGR